MNNIDEKYNHKRLNIYDLRRICKYICSVLEIPTPKVYKTKQMPGIIGAAGSYSPYTQTITLYNNGILDKIIPGLRRLDESKNCTEIFLFNWASIEVLLHELTHHYGYIENCSIGLDHASHGLPFINDMILIINLFSQVNNMIDQKKIKVRVLDYILNNINEIERHSLIRGGLVAVL